MRGHFVGAWPENQQPPDGVWSAAESSAFDTLSQGIMTAGLHYGSWNPPAGGVLETDLITDLAKCRAAVVISWPTSSGRPADAVTGIQSGKYDSVIQNIAGQMERARTTHLGRRVIWRPFWEMNGSWMPWYAGNFGNDATIVRQIFQRVVNVGRAAGFQGEFSWSPQWHGTSSASWNAFSEYYPGDAYVDIVGCSIYNSFTADGNPWRSFDTLVNFTFGSNTGGIQAFAESVNKPLQMDEGSSIEDPADTARKGQWIDDMGTYLAANPRWKGVIWFHRAPNAAEPTKNYRVDTTTASLTAWRNFVDSHWAHSD